MVIFGRKCVMEANAGPLTSWQDVININREGRKE